MGSYLVPDGRLPSRSSQQGSAARRDSSHGLRFEGIQCRHQAASWRKGDRYLWNGGRLREDLQRQYHLIPCGRGWWRVRRQARRQVGDEQVRKRRPSREAWLQIRDGTAPRPGVNRKDRDWVQVRPFIPPRNEACRTGSKGVGNKDSLQPLGTGNQSGASRRPTGGSVLSRASSSYRRRVFEVGDE